VDREREKRKGKEKERKGKGKERKGGSGYAEEIDYPTQWGCVFP